MYAKSTKGKGSTVPSEDQAKEKLASFVYEYLLHVGAYKAAQTFLAEIRWEKNLTLGEPPGFLASWWNVFWELYCGAPERRENFEHSIEAKAFHHYNASAPSPLGQMPPHNGMPGGSMPPRFSPVLEAAINEVPNLLSNRSLVEMNAMTGALDQDRINYEMIKQENGGGSKKSKKSVPGMSGVSPMQGMTPGMSGVSPMQGMTPGMSGVSPMQGMMPGMQPMPGLGYGPTMPGTSMGHNGNSPFGMSSNYTSYTHSMYPNNKVKMTRKNPCSMMPPCANVNAISAPFKSSFPDAVSQASSSYWPPVSTDFKPLVTAPEPTFPTYSENSVPIKTEASSSPHTSDCKASASVACFNESCKLMHSNEDLSLQEKMKESLQNCEMRAKNEVKESLFETFGEDLICIICSELFIKPSVLDCSHTFCEYCIKAWKKTKNNCPMCRKKIGTVTRVLTLDSFIEKTVEKLKPEERYVRAKLIKERQEAEKKSSFADYLTSTYLYQ